MPNGLTAVVGFLKNPWTAALAVVFLVGTDRQRMGDEIAGKADLTAFVLVQHELTALRVSLDSASAREHRHFCYNNPRSSECR